MKKRKFTEQMPPMNEYLLWATINADGSVKVWEHKTEVGWCSNGYPAARVRQIDLPDVKGAENGLLWAPVPTEQDPRWIDFWDKDQQSGYNEEVLVLAHPWNQNRTAREPWAYFWTPRGEPLWFPGFMQGPMTREEGVEKWISIPTLATTCEWKQVPKVEMAKMTPWAWSRKERQIVVEELATDISLSIINDGKLYKDIWEPICRGQYKGAVKSCHPGPWRRKGNREALLHSDGTGWGTLVHECACKVVTKDDQNYNVWYDAIKVATPVVLDYYMGHAKELAA